MPELSAAEIEQYLKSVIGPGTRILNLKVLSESEEGSGGRDKEIVTIEGLSRDGSHPLQRAWVEEDVPQCGYCQAGQIMSAAALLKTKPHPSRTEIVDAMAGNLCRCGTYNRIVRAIERAARG